MTCEVLHTSHKSLIFLTCEPLQESELSCNEKIKLMDIANDNIVLDCSIKTRDCRVTRVEFIHKRTARDSCVEEEVNYT